jgi:hypothetical protein
LQCGVRHELSDKFNYISLFYAMAIPFVFGPLFCPFGHMFLSILACCKNVGDGASCAPGPKELTSSKSSVCVDCSIIFFFTFVFVGIYPVQMYVSEVYIAEEQSMFVYMSFKYCYGCLHLILIPFVILAVKSDIRQAAVATYVRNNVGDGEITFEQLQEHCGIGVQPGA